MKISTSEFLKKYKESYILSENKVHDLAYWKTKRIIEKSDLYYLPEFECYYAVYNNHLIYYYSPDNICHISIKELNYFDCITMTVEVYDSIKENLSDFNPSYNWRLRYDFNYKPQKRDFSLYKAVNFDFENPEYYIKTAEIINNRDNDWLNENNIRKILDNYSKLNVFDPLLWFFIQDISSRELAAVSISNYDKEVRETDLDWIFVLPEYQGKGCGRFLIEETIRRCKDKSDIICVGGTVEFYRKCGFYDFEQWVWAAKPGYNFSCPDIQP